MLSVAGRPNSSAKYHLECRFPDRLGLAETKKTIKDLKNKLWHVTPLDKADIFVVYLKDDRALVKAIISHALSDAGSCDNRDIEFRPSTQDGRIVIKTERRGEEEKPSSAALTLFD